MSNLLLNNHAGFKRGGVVIGLSASAVLIAAGLLLLISPLEVIIVSLLIGSVLLMERG